MWTKGRGGRGRGRKREREGDNISRTVYNGQYNMTMALTHICNRPLSYYQISHVRQCPYIVDNNIWQQKLIDQCYLLTETSIPIPQEPLYLTLVLGVAVYHINQDTDYLSPKLKIDLGIFPFQSFEWKINSNSQFVVWRKCICKCNQTWCQQDHWDDCILAWMRTQEPQYNYIPHPSHSYYMQ